MRMVVETPTFQKQARALWSEDERLEFIAWIAANPEAGEVIPGAEGARKVRWGLPGRGKRGGARIIYFNYAANGVLVLVMIYSKSEREQVSPGDIEKAN